ncbi:nucleotidyltransferase family protein [Flavitalea flava]
MNNSEAPLISKAMILAAGLGTRFKPWTDRHPKGLALVNGKSLLQRNIEYLQGYGIRDLVVNIHHFGEQITAAIRENQGWGSHITISDESAQVLETGGGLKNAAAYLDTSPFILLNVDILTDLNLNDLIRTHFQHRPLATLGVTDRTTSRYFLFDEQLELCGWRNIQTGQEKIVNSRSPLFQKAFSGIHVIEPVLFSLMKQEGKFSIVDVYLDLAGSHKIRGFDHSHSKLIDVGKPESVAKAEELFP